jgi:LmbE family N-acetylglucosaminyl deacetylase
VTAQVAVTPSLRGRGTPEAIWSRCEQLADVPTWRPEPPASGRVLVVAPHPDDEILGVGGTIARLCRSGAHVELLAVTDGERSHPGMENHLRALRPQETLAAAARLGIGFDRIRRLEHRDGRIDESILVEQLTDFLDEGDIVLAPWARDGHPDHDATGRAAERATAQTGADLYSYLVWAWHWAEPTDLPWHHALRIDIADLATRKREAATCFRSQTTVDPIVLPAHVRGRLLRSYEVVIRT